MSLNEGLSLNVDSDLQQFLEIETQKRRFEFLVHGLTDRCWDLCMGKVSARLDGKTEGCLTNCVERFIDTTNFIVNRLEKTQSIESSSSFE
ncbi:mitochondrial import inner membrane translocase subunit Tim8 A, putative [Pediculus humanus corporis]|uniref:Mitochondrial import inner membrane translocase subunit n=1 Tax=Pediculus humanus subsp. corporis TaxID=121224 RepID=E0VLZ4_PEDHC|nr:mitochondrial import inner membrane translocase subunit Tim8 A, putative [Pediculus humanus corporis]EEB14400.1 mitochondrial import inner membrane translocase subunit Tim8 A, putative [Pediculus humanus corporis]